MATNYKDVFKRSPLRSLCINLPCISALREAQGHLAFDNSFDKEYAVEVVKQEPRGSHVDTTLSKACSAPNPVPDKNTCTLDMVQVVNHLRP